MSMVFKKSYRCVGGPWHGSKLWLSDGTTAVFRVLTWHGRYVKGMWEQV